MKPVIHWMPECASTSAELARMADAPAGTTVATHCQTAGRGQRGNSWEAEPGHNLTFSVLLRPETIPAARQFELSMLVALAVADTVSGLLEGTDAPEVTVKWPNDIYIGDSKVCGMLIENSLRGRNIEHSIAGIGVNINQRRFVSDAPNPVSVICYTGREIMLEPLLDELCTRIVHDVEAYTGTPADAASLLERYRSRLWRGYGIHPFRTPDGERFEAAIESIAPDGTLTLSNGRSFAFKEVIFEL